MRRLLFGIPVLVVAALTLGALALPGDDRTGGTPALAQDEEPQYRLVAPALAKNAPADEADETALAESLLLPPAAFDGWQAVGLDEIVRIGQCEPALPAEVTGEANTDAVCVR
ncbi:MAG: hypothetical protein U5Q44_12850 [Dehalococcoidia bacterium]|nr:hypothetical protein [Dehalococcoidia bacterium]